MNGFKQLRLSLFAIALAITTIVSSPAPAAQKASGGPFGLGVVLGDPTAITGKYFISSTNAIDGGFALNFDRWFLLYTDYLHHFPGAFGRANAFFAQTTPYIGIGGVLVFSNRNDWELRREKYFSDSSSSRVALGMRVPLGMEWRPPTVPIGVFVELVPGITIIPATYGFFQGGIGARFYF